MKKTLLRITLCELAFSSLQAQQKQSLLLAPMKKDNAKVDGTVDRSHFKNVTGKTRGGSTYIRYVDYVAAQESIPAATLDANSSLYNMFPDSVVRYGAPNSMYGIAWKGIGQVLEPWASVILDNAAAGEVVVGKTNSYTVDSVWVLASYVKKTAAVDTAILSVVHSGGANLPEYYFTGQAADFGEDTTRFLLQSYAPASYNAAPYQISATGAPVQQVIKQALTGADSSTFTPPNSYGIKYIGYAVNMTVPAGERVSMSYSFKPGYSYAAGDTIGKNNQMLFLSYEPNGDQTFMPFYATDRNMSSVVYKDSTNWYGDMIPTLAWTAPYGCEIHDIIWKISCATCFPTNTQNVTDRAISFVVSPNPATDVLNLEVNLKESANNVTINMTNMMGQVVKTINASNVNANNTQNFQINVSDVASGVYNCTISADGQKMTQKVMVK